MLTYKILQYNVHRLIFRRHSTNPHIFPASGSGGFCQMHFTRLCHKVLILTKECNKLRQVRPSLCGQGVNILVMGVEV